MYNYYEINILFLSDISADFFSLWIFDAFSFSSHKVKDVILDFTEKQF